MKRSRRLLCVLALLGCAAGAVVAQPDAQAPARYAVLGVPEEIAPIERLLAHAKTERIGAMLITSGELDGRPAIVGRSGIGKVNAAMAATVLLDRFHPAALIFSGTAGAVDPALNPGDVVVGTRVAQHDLGRITSDGFIRRPTRDSVSGEPNPMFFEAPEQLLAAARKAAADVALPRLQRGGRTFEPRVHEGVIATGDVFVADASKRDDLRSFGATAVEMEGAAMVQVCRQFATPCLVVRGITDSANASATVNYLEFLKPASENAAAIVVATIARLSR